MTIEANISKEVDSEEEFSLRVLYSLMKPVAKLASVKRIALQDLTPWMQLAYFHDLKDRGLKMREMSDVMGVSMRKVAMLSKQLKQNFLRPELEVELPRRIEFVLWAEPLSRARLSQALPGVTDAELDDALQILADQERIVVREEARGVIYDISSTTRRVVGREWAGKIDGVNNVMNNVFNAVLGRLFHDDARAFARTLQLHVREDDLEELRAFYNETIFPFLAELDERANETPDRFPIDVSILWAPTDLTENE